MSVLHPHSEFSVFFMQLVRKAGQLYHAYEAAALAAASFL